MPEQSITKKTRSKRRKQRALKPAAVFLNETQNQKILDHIRLYPQHTGVELAKKFRMPRGTMAKRLEKLADLGALQRRFEVNLTALKFNNRYRVDVTIDHKELKKKYPPKLKRNPQELFAEAIMKLNNKNADVIIEDVAVLMGDPADLCAMVRTRGDQKKIFDFVTAHLRPLDGCRSTSTCIEAWSILQERVRKEEESARQELKGKQAIEAKKRKERRARQAAEVAAKGQNDTALGTPKR